MADRFDEVLAAIGDVRAAVAQTRTGLQAEIAQTRTDLKAEIAQTRAELRAEMTQIRAEIMVRVDRLQDALTTREEYSRLDLHALHRVQDSLRSHRDEVADLAKAIGAVRLHVERLEHEIREIRGDR